MKTAKFFIRHVGPALILGLALFAGGCGDSAQQKAYEQAAKAEQQLTADSTPAVIAEYQRVIALHPGSGWAKKAQARIDAIQAQAKADELHKSVFQEHGID